MVGVHEDVGGGLPHTLPYGGRDDGVQECFVCSLLFKSVGSSCLCKLSHSFRHCGANTEQGGGRGGGVGVAWGIEEVILRIKLYYLRMLKVVQKTGRTKLPLSEI